MRVRAVLMTATGGPGVLKLAEIPEPAAPTGHDVRVRLRAAGVNPIDANLARKPQRLRTGRSSPAR
jgi:NADPH:quinone reductase